jgi:hypothetical protein
LLTTLLRPGKIIFAKLLAALRVSTVLTLLLTEQLFLAYFLLQELRYRIWTLGVFMLIILTTCLATSTIGLMCSALSRRTSVAMVVTYMTLLFLFVGPVGLGWYLQGFESISEERLASLTVTSPFSAALSVPMHAYRPGGFSNEVAQVDKQVLVPIARGYALPVWAIFLCIYPPICIFCYIVTYLGFRWRWWRAGGT